jgi:hypothetical protein
MMEAWPCGGVLTTMEHKRQVGLVNSFTTTIYEQQSSAVCSDAKEEKFVKVRKFTPYERQTDSSQELFPTVKARHVLDIYMRFGNKRNDIHLERAQRLQHRRHQNS